MLKNFGAMTVISSCLLLTANESRDPNSDLSLDPIKLGTLVTSDNRRDSFRPSLWEPSAISLPFFTQFQLALHHSGIHSSDETRSDNESLGVTYRQLTTLTIPVRRTPNYAPAVVTALFRELPQRLAAIAPALTAGLSTTAKAKRKRFPLQSIIVVAEEAVM
ncbi:hypothetical protein J6590_002438 [Homalodisca vitripennis]|nr:hypothetical protein J6590_002438 [Homalodisca vitripennis]